MNSRRLTYFLALMMTTVQLTISCDETDQCMYADIGGVSVLNCSSLNMDCFPTNAHGADVVDLRHNRIRERGIFKFGRGDDTNRESFRNIKELYLDHNIIKTTSSSRADFLWGGFNLEILSLNYNYIDHFRLETLSYLLRELYLDHNRLVKLPTVVRGIEVLSADFNQIAGENFLNNLGTGNYHSGLHVSCEHNRISKMRLRLSSSPISLSLKFGYNQITEFTMEPYELSAPIDRVIAFDLNLQHNPLSNISLDVWIPSVLNIDNTEIHDLKRQVLMINQNNVSMNSLFTRNNSIVALIQPEWAWNLSYINADFNDLRYITVETLEGFGELRELHLAQNHIAFISPTALMHITKLESLYLDGNDITSLFGGVFRNQTNLVTLSLTNNRIASLHPDDLVGLEALKSLNLSSNSLFVLYFDAFRSMPFLHTLDVSDNFLGSFDPGTCNDLRRLKDLTLSINQVDDISNLLQSCRTLETLNAEWNDIRTVSGAKIGPTLSRLELVGNPLHCDCRVASLRAWMLDNEPRQFPSCRRKDQLTSILLNETNTEYLGCIAPKAETANPQVHVEVGENALLTCQESGSPVPALRWISPNGTTVGNGWQSRFYIMRSTDLMILSARQGDAGNFTCLVVNDIGEEDSVLVNLELGPQSSPSNKNLAVILSSVLGCVITAIVTVAVFAVLYRCFVWPRQSKYEPRVNFGANSGDVSLARVEIGGSGGSSGGLTDQPSLNENSDDKQDTYQALVKDQSEDKSRPKQALPVENVPSLIVAETKSESGKNDNFYETPSMKTKSNSQKSRSPPRREEIYVNESVARQPRHAQQVKPHNKGCSLQSPDSATLPNQSHSSSDIYEELSPSAP